MSLAVSVCIPAYNPGPYLRPAVLSVFAQTFGNFELLIVDDCSDEDVAGQLEAFDDPRLRFQRNERHLGLVGNWNRCLRLATGRYITIFHQDDLMQPENLARKVALMDASTLIGLVYSNINCIDEQGRILGGHWLPQPDRDLILPGENFYAMVAETGNPVCCPSVVVRRSCFEEIGLFDGRLPFAADLEMWLRIAGRHAVGYLTCPLVSQRIHPAQTTARFAGTGRDYQDVLRALDITFNEPLPNPHARHAPRAYRMLSRQAASMARWKLRQGQPAPAARYAQTAMRAAMRAMQRPRPS